MSYSEKLLDPRWQKRRLEILQRDDFTCQKCQDKKTTLHVHHLSYKRGCEPWEYEDSNFITVCKFCHKILEGNKKAKRLSDIFIHRVEYCFSVDTFFYFVKYKWDGPLGNDWSCMMYERVGDKFVSTIAFDFGELDFFIRKED